ncbi:MAG: hypothetical protein Tsb005_09000 [Gammaproteobacteria bacterium]
MAITSRGIGSGLDITGIINQLIAVEGQATSVRIDRREARIQAEISAIGSLQGAYSEFQSALNNLSVLSNYQVINASSSDSSTITATATSDALETSYSIDVTNLAVQQRIASSAFTSATEVVGSGTLTFQFGTYDSDGNTFAINPERSTQTVTIDSSNNSLQGIVDAVNQADIGVIASIINDGSGPRVVFTSQSSGTANSLRVLVDDGDAADTDTNGLSQIAYDPTAAVGSGQNLTQTVAPEDATFTIDGISITSSSNTISDVINGVTLNLLQQDPGNLKTITVSRNNNPSTNLTNTFIASFNTLVDAIASVASYDPETETAGILLGDATVRSLETATRNIILSPVSGLSGTVNNLTSIGITTQRDGKLVLDSSVLTAAVANDPQAVARLFASIGEPSDSLVRFSDSSDDTVAGEYEVNITQLATQGTLVGSAAANLTITAGVNDTLVFEVDGVSATITLSAGTYTADNLAAEVQTRLNGDSNFTAQDIAVAVTQNAGVFTITSNRYGSASLVNITGGNGQTDFVGGSPTATAGVDVAGTIGGLAATGSGRVLTGTAGNAEGLALEILGGNTGNRGTINFSRGIAVQLNEVIDSFLAGDEGAFTTKTNILNNQVDDLDEQREALALRLESLEARLIRQFTALDTLLAQFNSTSQFLTQQLANLPGANSGSNR